ncbi:MAG: hypothetical protein ACKOW1_10670 [Novosphingobium sp.]
MARRLVAAGVVAIASAIGADRAGDGRPDTYGSDAVRAQVAVKRR